MRKTVKEQLYDLIVSGLPVALFVVDTDFHIVEFNQAAEEITGWTRGDVLGRICSDVLDSSLCLESCPLRESLQTRTSCMGREALITTKTLEKIPIMFSSSALTDEEGKLLYGIEVFRDASAVKKLEKQKNNILSLFTHDLKAPVAIAGGFVGRLLAEKAGPLTQKQQNYLRTISREIGKLEKYILSFLEISRIEAGQIELRLEPMHLGTLLQDLVEGFRLQAAEKEISLHLDVSADIPVVYGDTLQLNRVFSNLLDNAIKYSPAGESVQIMTRADKQYVMVDVRDNGNGIAADQLRHIFDSFYRVPGNVRKVGGTGLGLAAVKAIVEAHGGTTQVRSEIGHGSRFTVSLPL